MELNTIVGLVLVGIYILGIVITAIYVILTKSSKGKFKDVNWKDMKVQILMALVPVINYFPLQELFSGGWKK